MEDSTAVAEEKVTKNLPPTVITVDTGAKDHEDKDEEGSHEDRPPTTSETETRTPKHANKSLAAAAKSTAADDRSAQKAATNQSTTENRSSGGGGALHAQSQTFFAPRPYEGNMGGPTGAFQPHDRLAHQHNQLMAMQVSPGSGRYYTNYQGTGPGGQYPGYEQHRHREYGPPHPSAPYGQHMYPPQQYPNAYQQRQGPPQGWGPPGSYHNRPPPNYPSQHPAAMMQGYHSGPPPNSGSTFSRAVSSSFDRSVKSRDSRDKQEQRAPMEEPHHAMAPPPPAQDDRSVSEDGSWRQLNQIQSVDEEELRKRLAKRTDPSERQQGGLKEPASNSSSLTNSPTEEVEAAALKKDCLPDPPKMTNSLDSLSSVASAQAPLATKKDPSLQKEKPLSPADSAAASLDLMKCASGSSNLLLPSHQRSLSQFSFEGTGQKRTMEDERGDVEGVVESKEIRKAPSADESRPPKRSRTASDAHEKKGSPLSISCSPPTAPGVKEENKGVLSYPPTSKDSFYDKPPMYTYSIDSAPAMPREDHRGGEPVYPPLPRPHSSASSTIPPMPPLGDHGLDRHPGVSQMPSWEIQGQNSFGAESVTNPLVGTFSFTQDYPPLSRNNSMLSHSMEPVMPPKHHMHAPHLHHQPHGHERHHSLESRNQSFEGGHYHGSFSRADTMSFESRSKGVPDARQGYHQPHYPPHAPSWGSQGSYHPPPPPPMHYSPQYRMQMHPAMMRTYSQESGPGMPPNFQPPSEFQAPPTNLNKNRPRTEKHIMTTPFVASKSGVFGWTKEEDMRLTEIMKKHKNPRDWEPIAKELARNRT